MKLIALSTILLALLVFGCAKTAPENDSPKAQETVEQTSVEEQTSTTGNEATAALDSAKAKNQASQAEAKPESSAEPAKKPDTAKFTVYYFTSNVRCASCHKIENWTKEAVNKYFADDVKSGKMRFEMINIEEPEHEHYIDHYELFTKSVIVSKKVEGKEVSWKNLARVWNLLNDQNEFMTYIRDEVKTFTSGAGN